MRSKNEQFHWGGIHPFSYHPLVFHFIPDLKNKIAVDVGCGKGIWGYLIRATRELGLKGKLVGIDINKEYLEFCKEHKTYDKLIQSDIVKLPFKNKSIDFLLCSEVIEHLSKKDGKKFLMEVNRILKKGGRAVVTTPSIRMETVIAEGPDSHSSLWRPSDFREVGYKVYGMGVGIPSGVGKWYTPFVLGLGFMLTSVSYFLPGVGGYQIAVKNF